MKRLITKLIAAAICVFIALPAMAQLSEYKYLNGTYRKQGNGYKIEAKIDFNGIPSEGSYYDENGNEINYKKTYGYIKLITGEHQEGYNIVDVIRSGDGPIFMLAGWQFPRVTTAYPNFYNGTLQMVTDGDPDEAYLGEILKKSTGSSTAKAAKSGVKKNNKQGTGKSTHTKRKR